MTIFSYGFRPFFLLSGIFAAIAIAIWLPQFYGELTIRTGFTPVVWHAHEMLFGYLPAAMVGFLLTAIPNWTGRLPLKGWPLAMLVGLWLAGRVVVSISQQSGWIAAMIVDCSFLPVVLLVIVREIAAGKNLKNLKIALVIGVVAAANVIFHWEAHDRGAADYGIRIGISGMIFLVMIIGGRIIPSFTRNWLARQPAGRMPAAFNRFDILAVAVSGLAILSWIFFPDSTATGEALGFAGIFQLIRLMRWAGERTWSDRLVFVLHMAYLFVPIGFFLLAASIIFGIPRTAGIHAWTIGAMATLTLAVMTRATLGHTGRPLIANYATQIVYYAIVAAAISRVGASLIASQSDMLLHASALFWLIAFVIFVLEYGRMLLKPKLSAT